MRDDHVLYGNVFNSVSGNVSIARSGYVYRKTAATFKTFSLQICNVPRQVWGYKNVLNTKQNVTKTCSCSVFFFSLLYVLKMKFKGSGRFQNVTLLG